MALTRKFLAALGIEADKIEEIIEAHTDTVNALKNERDGYKVDAEKLPDIQKELDDLKEAAEKNKDNPYKAQYEDLKKEYDEYKADVAAKAVEARKASAYRSLLKEAGVLEKRIDSIMKVSNIGELQLDEENGLKDHDALIKTVKEEWADFIPTDGKQGAPVPKPPASNGDGTGKSRASKVAERYYANLYGKKGES